MLVGDTDVHFRGVRLISSPGNPTLLTSSLGYGCDFDRRRAGVIVTLLVLHTTTSMQAQTRTAGERRYPRLLWRVNPVFEVLDRCELPHQQERII